MHLKILQKKINVLKMCGPLIRLCLLPVRPIAWKLFNSLTTIETLNWHVGAYVTHLLWMREVPGTISDSGEGFYVWCFVVVVGFLLFLSKTTLCVTEFRNYFAMLIYLVYLWYCKICDRLKACKDTDLASLKHIPDV